MNEVIAIVSAFNSAIPIWGVIALIMLAYMLNDMRYIRRDLSNHITDTTKKIDILNTHFDKQDDRLLNQFNTQNKQVTDLYSVLLKSIQDSNKKK